MFPALFLNKSFEILEHSRDLWFFYKEVDQVILEKSSIKRMKYLLLFSDDVLIGPQMLVWINSDESLALHALLVENGNFVAF